MDDVLRQIVLTPGDENLLTEDSVRAIGLRLGPGAQSPDIRAGVGFGQAHRPAPHARNEVVEIGGLLLGGSVPGDGLDPGLGQQGTEGEGDVGALEHLLEHDPHGVGKSTASPFFGDVGSPPTASTNFA